MLRPEPSDALRAFAAGCVAAWLCMTWLPVRAHAQTKGGCPYGRDPVTQACLPRPTPQPKPPPKLVLSSNVPAAVYRVDKVLPKASPQEQCDPQRAGVVSIGQIEGSEPIALEKGLKRLSKMTLCFRAPDHAPASYTMKVPWSGASEVTATLKPYARLRLNWQCEPGQYPIAPEKVDLTIASGGRAVVDRQGAELKTPGAEAKAPGGELKTKGAGLKATYPLQPGKYKIDIAADGYQPGTYDVSVDALGPFTFSQDFCLKPEGQISLKMGKAPPKTPTIEGLTVRLQNKRGEEIWQGAVPKLGEVTIAARRQDFEGLLVLVGKDFSAFHQTPPPLGVQAAIKDRASEKSQFRIIPDSNLLIEREVQDDTPNMTMSLAITFAPGSRPAKADSEIDEAATKKACNDSGVGCASLAYLQRKRSWKRPLEAQALLTRGCEHDVLRACVALPLRSKVAVKAPVRPKNAPPPLLAAQKGLVPVMDKLIVMCMDDSRELAWLACLRLSKADVLPEQDFLLFDPTTVVAKQPAALSVEFTLDVMGAVSIDERLGGFGWVGMSGLYYFIPEFALLFGPHMTVAALPATAAATGAAPGDAEGHKVFGGAGLQLGAQIRPVDWFRINMVGFVSGYFTASGSTAGGYGGLNFVPWQTDTSAHGFELRGGAARLPNVVFEDGRREGRGGSLLPFAAIAYTASFNP